MILGTGIDIIEINRIRDSYEKLGRNFVEKILLESEIAYCLDHRDPAPQLAARFAAKEAISKAFGSGISDELGWHDIEITKCESGQPEVVLHGKGLELLRKRGASHIHLTLTHAREYAAAMAIVESE